jgi:peroxiredoxin
MTYIAEAAPPEADGYRRLAVGDPAPWFEQATSTSPRFRLDLAAGRYLLLCFLMGTEDPAGKRALELVAQNRDLFNDEKLSFFGVTVNWRDQYEGRTTESLPGIRYFWDFDLKISSLYGVVPADARPGVLKVRRSWFVLDPMLRIVAAIRFEKDGAERPRLLDFLRDLPPTHAAAGSEVSPPVLYLPNTFEPDLCRRLVAAFEAAPGSGRDIHRDRRLDRILLDRELVTEVGVRIRRRVAPEMAKAFLFDAKRTDQHIVACYREGVSSRFERDDASTASRFTLYVRLNEDYDGGEIVFPEYGHRRYRPSLGTALLFSKSILHALSPITRGRSYACLSSVYGDALPENPARSYGRLSPEDQVTPPLISDDQVTAPPIPMGDVGTRTELRNGSDEHQ